MIDEWSLDQPMQKKRKKKKVSNPDYYCGRCSGFPRWQEAATLKWRAVPVVAIGTLERTDMPRQTLFTKMQRG